MPRRVVFAPEANAQLVDLYAYLARKASPAIAERYVSGIIDACERLTRFPMRGTERSDVRPGLRVVGYKRRTAIAFAVQEREVVILGVFYGGQDLSARLGD
ncbi:MAG TPA: type II toxin-antitoxin system RelE/ParE family toxin [Terracidiphilus sp.]